MMYGSYGSSPGAMMWGGGSWLMMIGVAFLLLLIAVGVGIAIWAATQGGKSSSGGASNETPQDILRRRYANGEIDKKQYEEMKKDLMR